MAVTIHEDLPYSGYSSEPGVSQSMLKVLLEQSPLHLQNYLTAERDKRRKCLRVGDATHHLLLQPDDFDNVVAVLPSKYKDFRTSGASGWREEQEKRGLKVLSRKEAYDINRMISAVRKHREAGVLLSKGKPEVSLFAVDEDTGVMRKGRLDWLVDQSLIVDGPLPIVDVKTCESASPKAFTRAIRKLRYYFQAAYYLDLAAACGFPHSCFIIVAVESSPPFAVECYQIGPQSIELGRQEYKQALQVYKECEESGVWPSYNSGINIIEIV